jgi:hypothetical protein
MVGEEFIASVGELGGRWVMYQVQQELRDAFNVWSMHASATDAADQFTDLFTLLSG